MDERTIGWTDEQMDWQKYRWMDKPSWGRTNSQSSSRVQYQHCSQFSSLNSILLLPRRAPRPSPRPPWWRSWPRTQSPPTRGQCLRTRSCSQLKPRICQDYFLNTLKYIRLGKYGIFPLTLMGLLASCTIDELLFPPSKQAEKHIVQGGSGVTHILGGLESSYSCYLGLHTKFHNPLTTFKGCYLQDDYGYLVEEHRYIQRSMVICHKDFSRHYVPHATPKGSASTSLRPKIFL